MKSATSDGATPEPGRPGLRFSRRARFCNSFSADAEAGCPQPAGRVASARATPGPVATGIPSSPLSDSNRPRGCLRCCDSVSVGEVVATLCSQGSMHKFEGLRDRPAWTHATAWSPTRSRARRHRSEQSSRLLRRARAPAAGRTHKRRARRRQTGRRRCSHARSDIAGPGLRTGQRADQPRSADDLESPSIWVGVAITARTQEP